MTAQNNVKMKIKFNNVLKKQAQIGVCSDAHCVRKKVSSLNILQQQSANLCRIE